MAIVMKADPRTRSTKGALRQLRQGGQIPCVVYGKQLQESAAISMNERELLSLLHSQPNAVIEIDVPAYGKHSVMISEVQRDAINGKLLHIDFLQINMNEMVRTHVRIEPTGESAGVKEGGILQVIMHELEVQCLPGNIPEVIMADIAALHVGENLHVSDLQLPEGVEVKSDPDLVVMTVLAPQKELSEEEKEDADVELAEAKSRSDEAQHNEIATSS